MKKIGIGLFVLLSSAVVSAKTDQIVKDARKTIRNAFYQSDGNEANKVRDRLNDAERKLLELLPNQKTAREKAQCYYYAGMVQKRFNAIENTKLYLKLQMDTARFYDSLYKMYAYLIKCDSVEMTGRKKPHYRKKAQEDLMRYRHNLLNGGRYYLKKKDYKEAYRYLDMYLWSADQPVLKDYFLSQIDTLYSKVAYWATTAAYYSGNNEGVILYADAALGYSKNKTYIQEYHCKAFLATGDTLGWLKSLKNGIMNFPEHSYFFTNLMDYYIRTKQYALAMKYVDHMIYYDPKQPLYWFVKASVYMYQKQYKQCIDMCKMVLSLDSQHIGGHQFEGACYYHLAANEVDSMRMVPVRDVRYSKHRKRVVAYCREALPHLRFVKEKNPDDAKRWAPMLYMIYLNLNMGREFEEMEKIVATLNTTQVDE